MISRSRRAGSIIGATVALAACASLAGLSGSDGGKDAGVDAGHDAGIDAHRVDASLPSPRDASAKDAAHASDAHDAGLPDAPFVCTHASPVAAPNQISPGQKTVSFAAAVHMFTSGFTSSDQTMDGSAIGFDLDNTCTCPGPPSCASSSVSCDLNPGGHDLAGNEYGQLLENEMAAESSGDLNQRIALGQFTILIQVQDYNGGANDTNVFVGVLTGSNLGAVPKWDGTDKWPVDPLSALGDVPYDGGYTYAPSTGTASAWVNNYQLVAHLPPLTVGMGLGPITFTGGILSATISQDSAGQYSLVGQLAGRLTTHTLFAYAGHSGYYDDAGQIHKLCGTDPKFVMLQSSLCAQADIMGDPTLDSTDAGCNALSFALGFTTAPIQLGAPLASHYPSVGCDGSVTDCTP